ncbi:MAG: phosphate signaling complex protein PhoU [Thermoplasmata archaeon]|nr:phosphate signaling complex protein PhoU [Thermoplasmata archaeon]
MIGERVERKALSESMNELNQNMRTMSELAEVALRSATEGFASPDEFDPQGVFALDREIFGLREKIVRSCVDIIALHAPVAIDLRTITVSLETTTDLDRIGRYSKDIAEVARRIKEVPAARRGAAPEGFSRMAELTKALVRQAVEAFLARDAEAVREVDRADDVVDDLHDQLFEETVDRMVKRKMPVDVGAEYILVNRSFERVADHAVNIGLHTFYMVTGQRIRTVGKTHTIPREDGPIAGGDTTNPSPSP